MKRLPIGLSEDMYAMIKSRAELNRRSMSQEMVFLLEAALAVEYGDNLAILRTLMAAQGGIQPPSPLQ